MIINSRKLAIFILLLQFLFVFSIILDKLEINIPLIRQITGFIYLTFIIGFLILTTVIRITNIEPLEMLLYSVGLSLSFLMFLGLVINALYPYLGIIKPLSELPVLTTVFMITLPLSIMLSKSNIEVNISLAQKNINIILLFSILPFLSIFGSYQLCYYNKNLILLILYFIIALIPVVLCTFDKFKQEYWFIIWTISLSLLFSVALSKKYVIGGDAHVEYYFANLVRVTGIWNPYIPNSQNSLLRIVILHPIYSLLLNMSLTEVFRVVHPLLYSLVPVVLYIAFKKQFNEKIAFYSIIFFMFMHTFFTKLSLNTRMGIAELFLALFILVMFTINKKEFNKEMEISKLKLLAIIFILSIIFSHYGSSYFFMFILLLTFIFYRFSNIYKFNNINNIYCTIISLDLCILYITTIYGWYLYTASSENFDLFMDFINRFISELSEFLSPETSYTVYAITRRWVFSIEISKNFLIISLVFASIGLIYIVKEKKIVLQREYVLFSISTLCLLLSTFFPTKGFAIGRAYHFCLSFLAPFVVIGFRKILEILNIIIKSSEMNENSYFKILSIFLLIFLLFNSGIISEMITRNSDYSPNVLISKPRSNSINDPQFISALYRSYETDQEYFATKWLSERGIWTGKANLHLDVAAENAVYSLIGPKCTYIHVDNKTKVRMGYIYLRTYNLKKNIAIYHMLPWKAKPLNEVYPLNVSNKLYTNGGSDIYYKML